MEILESGENEYCETCVKGKSTKLPFRGTRPRATRPLERIHSDVCGPIKPIAYNGVNYFLTFIDDYTHFVVVFGLKVKSEVFHYLKIYEAKVTSRFSLKIAHFRSDNGGEYTSDEIRDFFHEKGTEHEPTIPGTPENNGVSERMNRTILTMARCILFGSCVRRTLWIESLMSAVYLLNRCPTTPVEVKTPAELWFGRRPDISNLRVFGCVAYVHNPLAGKVDHKAFPCIMLGYCTNGYRLWSLDHGKVITARNVIFNENKFRFDNSNNWIFTSKPAKLNTDCNDPGYLNFDEHNGNLESFAEGDEDGSYSGRDDENEGMGPQPDFEEFIEELVHCEPRRSTRVLVRPKHLQDYVQLAAQAKFVSNFNVTDNELNDERAEDIVSSGTEGALNPMEHCNDVPANFEELRK
jgi:transposase InsO family protein